MTNHDALLVFGLWAAALVVWGLVLLHDRWQTAGALIDHELTDHELTDAEVDAEFVAITAELEPGPVPYDHEKDGL